MMAGEMRKSALMAVDEINQSDEFDFTFAPHLRDPGGRRRISYRLRRSDPRRTRRSYRRLLHVGLAQAGHPDRRTTERLLWHPARYEGFESSDNVIYVGAAPNQHVVPLVRHMLDHIATDVFCIGSNYIWTWEMNRVIREIVTSAGGHILAERLLELGETAVDHIVNEVVDRRPPVVFNTLVGGSSYAFMRALHAAASRAGLSIPDAELQPVRARAQADRVGGLGRMHHLICLFREHRGARKSRLCGAVEGPPRRGQQPLRRWTVDLCLRHAARSRHSAARGRRRLAPSGALRPIIATIPRRGGKGRPRQQSLLPDAAIGTLRAWMSVPHLLGGGCP